MVKKLPKTRLTVYEYKTQNRQATGTAEELVKQLGIKEKSILNHSRILGYVYPEVKVVDLNASETFYGTAEETTEITGLSDFRINKILRYNNKSPNWDLVYTGRYVEAAYKWSQKKVVNKKSETVSIQPVTPMSEYAQQLFEHSTRHLRRDA